VAILERILLVDTLVPKHNIKLHSVSAVGLRGKNLLTLIKAPFLLLVALLQTLKVFLILKPDVVLGMGGFASGLGGVVAWLLRIPLVVHEQNSIPGTTNKILSKIATQTFQAFDGAFNGAITSGNPVLFTPKTNSTNNKKLNLLIVGGSLGSKPINDIVSHLKLDTPSPEAKPPIPSTTSGLRIRNTLRVWSRATNNKKGALIRANRFLPRKPTALTLSYYIAYGICSWFAMQISVNIAMNIGLMPIKGFTLPLISYGGSSMIPVIAKIISV
jgi:hypothetical protein